MKHFYCDFRVQHLNLHKNWQISFLQIGKSEILYISVICLHSIILLGLMRERGVLLRGTS